MYLAAVVAESPRVSFVVVVVDYYYSVWVMMLLSVAMGDWRRVKVVRWW